MEGSGGYQPQGNGPGPGGIPGQQPPAYMGYGGYDPSGYQANYPYGVPNMYSGMPPPFTPPQKFNGKAIVSLSCGGGSILLIGAGMVIYYCLILLGPLALIASLVGIVFGIMALNEMKSDPLSKGKGLAIAGLITSGVTLLILAFLLLIILAVVVFVFSSPMYEVMLSCFI